MCLAVPGKILEIDPSNTLMRTARVSFGGAVREISLALVPEAEVGGYVLAHAGIGIGVVDEEEAGRIFEAVRALDALEENEA